MLRAIWSTADTASRHVIYCLLENLSERILRTRFIVIFRNNKKYAVFC